MNEIPKNAVLICSCGHPRESHRSEATYDITYCRKCNCDYFSARKMLVDLPSKSEEPGATRRRG